VRLVLFIRFSWIFEIQIDAGLSGSGRRLRSALRGEQFGEGSASRGALFGFVPQLCSYEIGRVPETMLDVTTRPEKSGSH
jgi:hypothetical protein